MRRTSSLLVAVALTATAAQTATAGNRNAAKASCMPVATALFGAFGDTGLYFLAPGGSFEPGSPAWTITGQAAVVAGSETFAIGGAGVASLSLPPGSAATSPPFCVTADAPTMRFFVRNAGGPASRLAVDVLFQRAKPKGATGALQVATVSGTTDWGPTPIVIFLANLLALTSPDGTTSIAFRLRPLDAVGAWQVDDVYVDPFKRH